MWLKAPSVRADDRVLPDESLVYTAWQSAVLYPDPQEIPRIGTAGLSTSLPFILKIGGRLQGDMTEVK